MDVPGKKNQAVVIGTTHTSFKLIQSSTENDKCIASFSTSFYWINIATKFPFVLIQMDTILKNLI